MDQPHPLFDPDWYRRRYPEVAASGLDPLVHYVTAGDAADYWPHPLFDPHHYGSQFPEVPRRDGARLAHYCEVGGRDGASPHAVFHAAWYLEQHPEIEAPDDNPLWHYVREGEASGAWPNPLFDPVFYASSYPDRGDWSSLLAHYVHEGAKRKYWPNALFDAAWYEDRYADGSVFDSLTHYFQVGDRIGCFPHPLFNPVHYGNQHAGLPAEGGARLAHFLRDRESLASPNALFDVAFYRSHYPELVRSGANVLVHYVEHGDAEDAWPHPLFDPVHYGSQAPDLSLKGGARLIHYLDEGAGAGINPHPLFDAVWYAVQYPDLDAAEENPLIHYLYRGDPEEASPHPLFDPAFYGEHHPLLPRVGGARLVHYLERGAREGASPHAYFDTQWYAEQFPELMESGANPLVDYLGRGDALDASPHPLFDPTHYAVQNEAIARSGGARLVHYLQHGAAAGASPHPLFAPDFYWGQGIAKDAADADALAHYLKQGDALGLSPHPLFDAGWYRSQVRDLSERDESALVHYIKKGDRRDASPHPLFNPNYYLEQYPAIRKGGAARLLHYVGVGGVAGASPHTLFDGTWYARKCPELAETGENPLLHYLRVGEELDRSPHPLFDPGHYRRSNPDLVGIFPLLVHYAYHGVREGRAPNALFDPVWYTSRYPDAADSELDPLTHYCQVGDVLDYWPNPVFDPSYYSSRCPEVPRADGSRLRHYMETEPALAENPHPLFDSRWYARNYLLDVETIETPLSHYFRVGEDEGCRPHPLFDPSYYRENNSDLLDQRGRLLAHYLRVGAVEGRKPNPLFDALWYSKNAFSQDEPAHDALRHYAETGAEEGLSPHPLFDPGWYRDAYMEGSLPEDEPLAHFLEYGAEARHDPHPLFDSSWYREFHRLDEDEIAIVHYLEKGAEQGLQPTIFFDTAYYESRTGIVIGPGQSPLEHFVSEGWGEGHRPSPIFDFCLRFFREREPDADRLSGNPFSGFFTPDFSSRANPDAECPIRLEPVTRPAVSIVVPAFGPVSHTLACLRSLTEAETGFSFEVIVVDDGIERPGAEALARIENLVLIRNARNLGFLGSCNRGAKEAKAEKLVFLNNDTLVTDGWLDEMIATFTEFSGAGIVGSRLLHANGRLQEAGSLLWAGGVASNRGFGQEASDPRFLHARTVDYVSAASLMMDRALFEELEGFDEAYLPAFYEDTDLAFRVREAGSDVVCQPASTVIHFGGRSYGLHPKSDGKIYQEGNREFFARRWEGALQDLPEWVPGLENDRSSGDRGSILVMDATLLTPDQDSGSLRMQNLLRTLRRMRFDVTFLPADLSSQEKYVRDLERLGIRVACPPHCDSVERFLEIEGSRFDACILSRPQVGERWIKTVRTFCSKAVVFYDTVDLHFLRRERELAIRGTSQVSQEEANRELRSCRNADAAIVVSDFDRRCLMRTDPGIESHIVSNIHEVHPSKVPFELRSGLLFIGGFNHAPNQDGVTWFVREILPRIHQRVPDAVLRIVGSKMPPEIYDLASDRVICEGFVEDVVPLLERARVSIAPLRYGSGVKGKVNQTMSFGVPCVATSIAVEGVEAKDGVDILVADTEEAFADSVVQLYTNENLWRAVSRESIESLERNFSMEVAESNLRRLLLHHGVLDD